MKRFFVFPAAVALFLLCTLVALASDWQPITDEIDVDFSSNIVRAYAVVKQGGNNYTKAQNVARKTLLAYIETLTAGKERIPLKKEFDKRPALYAKVQHVLERAHQSGESAFLPATDQYGQYFLFDLKLLKQFVPDINFPVKEDTF